MKKVLSLLLCLCMLLSCAAFADGYKAHVTLNVQGKSQADINVTLAEDNDGCYQLSVNGIADGEPLDLLLQIGQSAMVLGENGQYAEIDYEELIAALQEALPEVLDEEQLMVLGLVAYAVTGGLESDLEIVGDLLENEVTRLLNVGMSQGIITYTRDGIVFEANQDQLLKLAQGYVASLSMDSAVFGKLSETQIWSLAGLSEGGVQEQAMVAQFSKEFAQVTLPDTFSLYIKAVIGMSGTIDATIDLKVPEEEIDLNLTAKFDGNVLDAALVGTVEEVNIDCTWNLQPLSDGVISNSAMTMSDGEQMINATEQMVISGSVISGSSNMVANINGQYATSDVSYNFDIERFTGMFKANMAFAIEGEGTGYINIDASLDEVNGLYLAVEVTDPDGVLNAIYIQGNAQANEYGAVADLGMDMVIDGVAIDDMFRFDAVISDVIRVHAHLNSYSYLDDDPYYSEYFNEYYVTGTDLFGTSEGRWMSPAEYEDYKASFESGVRSVFTVDALIDLNTYAVDISFVSDDVNFAINGAEMFGNYLLTVSQDGENLLTATLEVVNNDALQSLLLGKLTVTVPEEELVIVRTTEFTDDGAAWVFNVTEDGETTSFTVGYRDKSEGNRENYEVYISSQGMSYTAGVVYQETNERVYGEVYVRMASGMYSMDMFKLTVDITPVYGTVQHVSGQKIPQYQLKAILVDILDEVMDEAEDAMDDLRYAF